MPCGRRSISRASSRGSRLPRRWSKRSRSRQPRPSGAKRGMRRAPMKSPRLQQIDLSQQMRDKESYEKALRELQLRLLRLQQAYYHAGRRAIILFEGWDAAGKGGAIRRLTEKIDPRGIQV